MRKYHGKFQSLAMATRPLLLAMSVILGMWCNLFMFIPHFGQNAEWTNRILVWMSLMMYTIQWNLWWGTPSMRDWPVTEAHLLMTVVLFDVVKYTYDERPCLLKDHFLWHLGCSLSTGFTVLACAWLLRELKKNIFNQSVVIQESCIAVHGTIVHSL